MEKVNDIFNNLKDRFSNPLIFSFVCSWLVINWRITIALLWYDAKQFENGGKTTVFDFISSKINSDDSLWHPLFFALCYTFLIPIIKNLIKAFYSWSNKWGDNWNLKILDGGNISINKYLKLRADHEKRTKILEDVISKESTYIDNYNLAKTDLLAAQNNINEMNQRLTTSETFIRELYDWNIIQGNWENNYELPDGRKGKESIFIERGMYNIVTAFGSKEHRFDIKDFYYDNRNGNIFFVKTVSDKDKATRPVSEHYNINRLKFESKDLLVGTENNDTKIEYRRK